MAVLCSSPARQADQVGRILGHVDVRGDRQAGDPGEHRDREDAHDQQRRRGVAALRWLERRDPVGHRLDPGQGGAAGGERAQHQEDREQPAGLGALLEVVAGALRGDAVAEEDADEADREQQQDRDATKP